METFTEEYYEKRNIWRIEFCFSRGGGGGGGRGGGGEGGAGGGGAGGGHGFFESHNGPDKSPQQQSKTFMGVAIGDCSVSEQ